MLEVLLRLALALILLAAAAAKLIDPRRSAAAMETFGFETNGARRGALGLMIVAETALGVGVAIGSDRASYLAAALMLLFAATLGSAMMRGRVGAPCACFGPGSTVGWGAIARNLLLAFAFAALPSIADAGLGTDGWLGVGLALALLACATLAVAVLGLTREVRRLRLRLGLGTALEGGPDGPEVGGGTALIEQFDLEPGNELALAVFTAIGCHVCRVLAESVELLRRDPTLAVASFEESADSVVFEALAIPGVPYAIAIDRDGTVLAKGAVSNLAQLEGVIATASRRKLERERIETLGV